MCPFYGVRVEILCRALLVAASQCIGSDLFKRVYV